MRASVCVCMCVCMCQYARAPACVCVCVYIDSNHILGEFKLTGMRSFQDNCQKPLFLNLTGKKQEIA